MTEPYKDPVTDAGLGDPEVSSTVGSDAPQDRPTEALTATNGHSNGHTATESLPEASNGNGSTETMPRASNGHTATERLPEAGYAHGASVESTEPKPLEKRSERRRKHRFVPRLKTLIIMFLLAIPLALAAIGAYATNSYSQKYEDKILPGATIAGVDVGGMSRKEAVRAVKNEIGPQMRREIKVEWRKQSWTITPKELGARSDAAAAVERALVASQDTSMFDKAQMRWLDKDLDFTEDVALRYPKKGAVSFIAGLAQEFNENPLDASIDYSSGWVEFVKETMGRQVDEKASASNLLAALRSGDGTAGLEVDLTKPDVLVKDFNQVLLLRQSDFTVYMYVDGKIAHEWPVAVGQSAYPTPTGQWTVIDKVEGPTWTNPAPDGWGADMPATIPPGISNPLGLAAVYWDASGIRFHGTSDVGSIGTAASHGCVRMYNEDVLELYGLVDIGTPIISVY